jgi:glycosyltransferase involved in cell wall biosynthesis
MKKLNILQVVNTFKWNAISSYALVLSKGLKNRGHKVLLITLPESRFLKRAKAEGLKVITLKLNHNNFFIALKKMMHLLREEEINILNVHESQGFIISCLATKLVKRPIALIRTRGTPMIPNRDPINRYLYNSLANKVIVTSNFMREECLKRLRGKKDHYLLIYGGVDTKNLKPCEPDLTLKQNLGLEKDAPVIGFIGRFDPVKGHKYFFEAASKIAKNWKSKPRIKFLVIGYESKFSEIDLLNMAKICCIKEDLLLVTKWVELSKFLSIIDIGVISSIDSEANSRVCLEFMACGKPVVATTVGVIPEIIEDGKTGYLVQPKDVQTMAEIVAKLLKDKQKLKTIGEAARKVVEERFREDNMIKRTEELYYQVLMEKFQ